MVAAARAQDRHSTDALGIPDLAPQRGEDLEGDEGQLQLLLPAVRMGIVKAPRPLQVTGRTER